ncbi:MAG: hypothetical protein JNK58_12935 [Phycisphaerae bacterium]|nr:hypothetical protein [Phycisphaerae bacterium]
MNHANLTNLTVASLAFLASASFAAANVITEPTTVTIENVANPANFYSSLLLFPVDQTGQPIETAYFNTGVVPGVFIGDENSLTPRDIASYAYIDDFGNPGNLMLRIDFPVDQPWSPAEMLSFHFVIEYEEGVLWKLDFQLTPVPAPGATAAFALLALAGTRRRR